MPAVDSLNSVSGGMTPANWIAIGSIAVTIIGSLAFLIFRSGKVIAKLEHVDADIHHLKNDVQRIDAQVSKISGVEQRLDTLWSDVQRIDAQVSKISGVEQRLDTLWSDVQRIDGQVSKIPAIEQRLDSLWKSFFSISKSPMQLNERGLKVLEDSGIKELVDSRFDSIVQQVKSLNPKNAYEVQEFTAKIVEQYAHDETMKESLQIGAFKSGVDIFTVLFSGSVYIRDRVLAVLGFNVEDIDKHQPDKA